ncbi:MAG: aminopeptidase P family protein [Mediterranea sp.]|jgi:Xaa-Pro aminopeptidase|nr:aminopeptidase P family protein [Mediterranea sp.]
MEHPTIIKRIERLRAQLAEEGVQAFIIPSADPHLSEYVSDHWKSREWISGFTGSAGTVVITANEAGLWTDSRYFLQAAEQLKDTGITLYKEMLPETLTIPQFLSERLQPSAIVGIDGNLFAADAVKRLQKELSDGITVRSINDPMDVVWNDRPPLPDAPAFIYELRYAGQSVEEKFAAIRKETAKQGAKALLLSALDEIAWTLNLRGSDVQYNPVVISYLLVAEEYAHLFIAPDKVTPEVEAYLKKNGVLCHKPNDIRQFLREHITEPLLLDPAKTNYAVTSSVDPTYIIIGVSPVALLKAVRNTTEIAGLRNAMQRDGVALVKFWRWLEEAVPQGGETELSITRRLHDFRAEQALYMGESFETIAGYKEHAAIVHYEATPETDSPLRPEGMLLLDSGAQYLDGTTDITRTLALGALTYEEKRDYTLVLKGHIALAMAKFPVGTRGAQLDVLARMSLWKHSMNYLHGTGHGIGHFLNVHEGPQSIRMNENPVTLQAGMVTSNEPGVYIAGSHGVRIENLVLTVPSGEGMFGDYLQFETVTLCPICRKGIIREMLAPEEVAWLNNYHRKVYELLSPALNKEEQTWLKEQCSEL